MRSTALLLCLLPALAGADETEPLHAGWSPLLVPASFIAPGAGHLLRGERKLGGRMLAISGAAWAVTLASGLFLFLSGASDLSAAIGVPIVLLAVSTLITLSVTDIVGTFGSGPAPPLTDTWNARTRVGLTLLAPMHRQVQPSAELEASWRGERWLAEVRASSSGPAFEGLAGVRVLRYSEHEPRAGVWIEAGLRGGATALQRSLRTRVQLVSALPMGIFGERLSRLTSILRIGVDPSWLWFGNRAATTFELGLSGGFELHFTASESLRLLLGYEHSRDAPVGGLATGFLGTFNAGLELALTPQLFAVARGHFGTPNAFTLGLEWRLAP